MSNRPTKQIALDLGCRYMYDDWGRINQRADKLKIGDVLVAETLPTNGQLDFSFMPVVRTSKQQIFAFLKHCDFDFKGYEVGEIVDEMTELAKRYIMRLMSYTNVDAVQDYNVVLDFMDANMAGVRVTLTTTDNGACVSDGE